MINLRKFLSLLLCMMIFISFNGFCATDGAQSEESTIEKTLPLDLPLTNLIEPLSLINTAVFSEEINLNFNEPSKPGDTQKYSFLTSDLPPPLK